MKLNGNIVITLENVLFNTLQNELSFIQKYQDAFKPYIVDIPENIDGKDIPDRNMIKLLAKNHTPEEIIMIRKILLDLYIDNTDIYDKYITETKLSKTLQLSNIALFSSNVIQNITIFYYPYSPKQAEFYKNMLPKIYKDKKFIFKNGVEESIIEYLKNYRWDLFISDNCELIQEIAETLHNLDRKEFLIPKYKYNVLGTKVTRLINELGGAVNYYKEEI